MRKEEHKGCKICQEFGTVKSGWVTVYRPHPAREDRERTTRGATTNRLKVPIIVSGAIRCPCWPNPEHESAEGFDLRGWLKGWRENMDWHEWAIEHSTKATKDLDELRFQRQQVLAAQVLGRVG